MTSQHCVRVGELIPSILARWKIEQDSPIRSIRQLWKKSVPQQVAQHTFPLAFREGVLLVSADSAAWAAELARFHRESILCALNEALGRGSITRLRFTTRQESVSGSSGERTDGEGPNEV